MSEISITRTHKLSMKKARLAADHVVVDLERKFGLTCVWGDDGVLRFDRPGVSGQLVLARHEVTVEASLSFFFLPFRAALEREIHDYFDQRFA